MEQAILLSIQPQHAAKILNGDKTLELRKSVPKDYKGWVNLYCVKGIKDILYKYKDKYYTQHYLTFTDYVEVLNSKVVARFWFDEYEKVECRTVPYNKNGTIYDDFIENGVYKLKSTVIVGYGIVFERRDKYIGTMLKNKDFIKMCLTPQKLHDYIGLGNNGYVWHINQLEIFDEPLSLSDFYVHSKDFYTADKYGYENENLINYVRITKAPQSWRYVYYAN